MTFKPMKGVILIILLARVLNICVNVVKCVIVVKCASEVKYVGVVKCVSVVRFVGVVKCGECGKMW